MCKYEMDLASIVEVTCRADTILSTDRWMDGKMDGQTDRRMTWNPPFNFVEEVGITTKFELLFTKFLLMIL